MKFEEEQKQNTQDTASHPTDNMTDAQVVR